MTDKRTTLTSNSGRSKGSTRDQAFICPAEIKEAILKIAAKTGFSTDAVLFLLSGLQASSQLTTLLPHTDAEALCWNLRDHASRLYGSNAQQQLALWGVKSTEDFGVIMYSLIEHGLARKSDQDFIEQFANIYDFDTVFAKRPLSGRLTFSLSLLFVMTTLVAVFTAGAKGSGLDGGVAAVLASWIALIGGFCVVSGVRESGRDRMLWLIVGIPLLLYGITAVWRIVA